MSLSIKHDAIGDDAGDKATDDEDGSASEETGAQGLEDQVEAHDEYQRLSEEIGEPHQEAVGGRAVVLNEVDDLALGELSSRRWVNSKVLLVQEPLHGIGCLGSEDVLPKAAILVNHTF